MTAVDDVLANARSWAAAFDKQGIPLRPAIGLAVVACMDARFLPSRILGLSEGDAHIIRNAGGVVTDDTIRSLAISQHLLETREVLLVHHTDCGLEKVTDDGFGDRMAGFAGFRPTWSARAFRDADQDVRESIRLLRDSPFLMAKDGIRGTVYDVETGVLREVSPA